MSTFDIEVYLDGTLIDCEDYGNVRVTTGIFGPIRQGSPHQASIDVYRSWTDWGSATELQVVIVGPPDASLGAFTAPPAFIDTGSNLKMCIFKGLVQARKGVGPQFDSPKMTISAVGQESFIFNRRTTTAAANDTGYRAALNAILTDEGETTDGYLQFPDDTALKFDRPAQDGSIGQAFATAGACHGNWTTCQWLWDPGDDPDLTELWWRPSHYQAFGSPATTNQQALIDVSHAWLLNWADVGMSWGDLVARIRVTGETSASVATSGSAAAGTPTLAGNKTLVIDSWIDNNTDCGNAASRLINRMAGPVYNQVYDVAVPIDWYTDQLDTGFPAYSTAAALFTACEWVSALPGDTVQWFIDSIEPWPTANPDAASLVTEFETILGFNAYSTTFSEVTGTSWEWDPATGWTVHHSLTPKS